MATVVRGTMVFFSAALVDASGNPATPSSAKLYVVYVDQSNARQKATVDMSVAGNVVSAQWDSSIAAPCVVQWTVKAIGANAIAQDGNLTITANESNPTS